MELATINQSPVTLALQSQKVIEMKKQDAMKQFIDLLSKTYFDAGQVVQGYNVTEQSKYLQAMANALHEEIKDSFPFIRIDELKLAFKHGLRGEYGEYFGLNIKTYNQWIKGWQFDQKRQEAIKRIKEANEREPDPIMSKEQAELAWKKTIQDQFKKYKETGFIVISMPFMLFTELENRGVIKITTAEKWQYIEKAKEEFKKRMLKKRQLLIGKTGFHAITELITRLETKQTNAADQNAIKAVACELAILEFYDKIETINL